MPSYVLMCQLIILAAEMSDLEFLMPGPCLQLEYTCTSVCLHFYVPVNREEVVLLI